MSSINFSNNNEDVSTYDSPSSSIVMREPSSPPPIARIHTVGRFDPVEISVPNDLFLPTLSSPVQNDLERGHGMRVKLRPRQSLILDLGGADDLPMMQLWNPEQEHDSNMPSVVLDADTFSVSDDDDESMGDVFHLPKVPEQCCRNDDSATTWLSSCATNSFESQHEEEPIQLRPKLSSKQQLLGFFDF
eukprot:CAMPEP_0198145218 /NCGR_PEP_ID=MMETSP1443-20131203/21983_1 /TAXON_ID=186043 /ORGANISM="Entomoneis sp., Strain CCMP2396" /LENGTH=188 /DNA_ID=CAMNT_0043808787 /DNA_START=44 /DNA_END=610 /DNA_ORIENTATION=-